MSIVKYTYPNGLKLVYQRIPQKVSQPLTAISVFCKVGSNNEPKPLHGVSHLIEHMMFKGTENISDTKGIAKIFDSVGAYFNAYTDKNVTCYTVKTDSEYIDKIFETLTDMLCNSKFEEKEFEREKKVVVEEIDRAKDNTGRYINDKIYTLLFKGDRLENPIGSVPEIILKYKYSTSKEYFDNFYKPDNMVISICSDKPFEDIKALIEKTYLITKQTTPFKNNDYQYEGTLEKQTDMRIKTLNRKLEQSHIAFGFRTCDLYDPDTYILDIIRIVIAGNMSSRLFINLREKNGLTYNVSVDKSEYETSGMFCILTSVDHSKIISYKKDGKDADGAIRIIVQTLNDIITNGITQEELDKAKGYIRGSVNLSNEDSLNISDYNGRMVVLNRKFILPIKQVHRLRYSHVPLDVVNNVVQKYFRKDLLSLFIIGDKADTLDKKLKTELSKLVDTKPVEEIPIDGEGLYPNSTEPMEHQGEYAKKNKEHVVSQMKQGVGMGTNKLTMGNALSGLGKGLGAADNVLGKLENNKLVGAVFGRHLKAARLATGAASKLTDVANKKVGNKTGAMPTMPTIPTEPSMGDMKKGKSSKSKKKDKSSKSKKKGGKKKQKGGYYVNVETSRNEITLKAAKALALVEQFND